MKLTLFIAIPSAFGVGILSYPVMYALYPGSDVRGAAILLSLGAVSVISYSLSTVTNGVLQGLGFPRLPVIHAAIGLLVNVVITVITVLMGLHVYGILAATVVYSITVMFLNARSVRKLAGYRHSLRQFLPPLKSAFVMGIAVAVIYWAPKIFLPGIFGRYLISALLMAVSVLAGILVYFIIYGKVSDLTDDELRRMPMGTRLLSLLRKLHVR